MKLRALLVALFVFGVAVSVALADPGHGKGKGGDDAVAASTDTTATTTTGTTTTSSEDAKGKGKHGFAAADCWPKVGFVFRGTLETIAYDADPATVDSMTILVTKANRHGWYWVGKQVSIVVGEKTNVRLRGQGPADLEDIEKGYLVKVHVRACKYRDEGTAAAALSLYAKRVIAKAPKPHDDAEATETTPTTTTPTTTTATTTTATTSTPTTTEATTTAATTTTS